MTRVTSHKSLARRFFSQEVASKLARQAKADKPELVFTPVCDHKDNLWRVYAETKFGEAQGWVK